MLTLFRNIIPSKNIFIFNALPFTTTFTFVAKGSKRNQLFICMSSLGFRKFPWSVLNVIIIHLQHVYCVFTRARPNDIVEEPINYYDMELRPMCGSRWMITICTTIMRIFTTLNIGTQCCYKSILPLVCANSRLEKKTLEKCGKPCQPHIGGGGN
jgi:hypothetical protein